MNAFCGNTRAAKKERDGVSTIAIAATGRDDLERQAEASTIAENSAACQDTGNAVPGSTCSSSNTPEMRERQDTRRDCRMRDEHVAAEKQRTPRADEPGDEMQRLHFEQ